MNTLESRQSKTLTHTKAKASVLISWQWLLAPTTPGALADSRQTPAAKTHVTLDLAPMLIPALRMLLGFGYRLWLLPPTLDDGDVLTGSTPDLRRESSGTATQEILEAALRLLSSQGILLTPYGGGGLATAPQTTDDAVFTALRDEGMRPQIQRAQSVILGASKLAQSLAQNLGIRLVTSLTSLTSGPSPSPHAPMINDDNAIAADDRWLQVAADLCLRPRMGHRSRRTQETNLEVWINLDGRPEDSRIETGIGFFDHMLSQISRHGGLELSLKATGDLHVDEHHLVEDTALALGSALHEALGERHGLRRYGFTLPMDEALAFASIDLSGRPHLVLRCDSLLGQGGAGSVGGLSLEMVPHFFQSLSQTLGATIHLGVHGVNRHHQVEGLFKAFGKALGQAIQRETRVQLATAPEQDFAPPEKAWELFCAEVGWSKGVPSTKGSLREDAKTL